MHTHVKVFSVIALLATAASPLLVYAKDDAPKVENKAIEKTAETSTAETLTDTTAKLGEKVSPEKAKEVEDAKTPKISPIPPGAPATFADIAHELLPAVVNISSTLKAGAAMEDEEGGDEGQMPDMPQLPPGSPFQDFFEQFMNKHGQNGAPGGQDAEPAIPPASLGSGFVIDADKGYIVTNNHVIKDAEEVRVTFGDDTTLEAKIIGKDEKMDLAVLQVKSDKKLTAVRFGDSDKMRVGDWVLAIGNPFGLGGTVTAGIVSAQQRNINAGPYDDFIQTDASINRGNSGGPMFDLAGEVIGINTAIFSPSGGSVGIGFAIPSNLASSVVNQLIEYGKTRRGWIGVRIQIVTDEIADSLGLKSTHGALVASITTGGPAEKAGLKAGDVITTFDGKEVNAMRNLPRIVAETPINKLADVKVWRNGKEIDTKIKVAELEKAESDGLLDDEASAAPKVAPPSAGTDIGKVGVTVNSLSETNRKQFNVPVDVKGVLVTKITPKGEAAQKGLTAGDVIVEIAQEKIDTPKQAADAIDKAVKDGKSSVLLLVNRESDVRFVALRLKTEKK